MCGFYCIAFIEYLLVGKTLLDYTNSISSNDYKKKDKISVLDISVLRANTSSLEYRLKKIDETRNYYSEEIKHNNLISEMYKKTCKYLNYVEH